MLPFRAGDGKRMAILHNSNWNFQREILHLAQKEKKFMLNAAHVQYLYKLQAAAAFPEMKNDL